MYTIIYNVCIIYSTHAHTIYVHTYSHTYLLASAGPLDVMLRSLVINQMGRNGDSDVIAEAKKRFHHHVTSGDPIDSNLKSAIFSLSLASGGEETFEKLMEVHISNSGIFSRGCAYSSSNLTLLESCLQISWTRKNSRA